MTFKEAERKLKIKVDIIPAGSKNRPGRTLNATHVTIHNTANTKKGANAAMHARYVKGADAIRRKVSWHYTIDDKEAYKHLPLSEQGYHAGTAKGNSKSIGIEVCMNSDGVQAVTDDRAALLAAYLCAAMNIPLENVVPHQAWSGKNCPSLFLANNKKGWNAFMKQVRAYHSQMSKPPAEAKAPKSPVPSQLRPDAAEARIDDGRLAKLKASTGTYITNARPDTPDFRDRMYISTLIEVPAERPLTDYVAYKVPVLDQGSEGACTGFALATVVNYLRRVNKWDEKLMASPWMMYEMARKYDEWPGENYSGSSARGAMKAWHKHGVCSYKNWGKKPCTLTLDLAKEATARPLGAYFRVNHKDLVAMHAAITEVGILYATASVHDGWGAPDAKTGKIKFVDHIQGGHAFVIVGYDEQGFWIQNSWGPGWGKKGFAHLSYSDWLKNGTDVWVARMGVPVRLEDTLAANASRAAAGGHYEGYASSQLRRHIVSLGNDGQLSSQGAYGMDADDLDEIVNSFVTTSKPWDKKRILLYAHGGLVDEATAVGLVSKHADWLIRHKVYPVAFIWHSGFIDTIKNVIEDAQRKRRPEGFLESTMDFMKDRIDDMLEPIARIPGKLLWDEMKENARAATITRDGGARQFLEKLVAKIDPDKLEIHVIGHSAGAIFLGPLVQLAATPRGKPIPNWPVSSDPLIDLDPDVGLGLRIATCTLWAPACRVRLFKDAYMPLAKAGRIGKVAVFALTDKAEQNDHCAKAYNKSLLYLVSNAFENPYRIPILRPDGAPILGMEKFINADDDVKKFFKSKGDLVLSPTDGQARPGWASQSQSHGGFDEDKATLLSTFERIVGPSVLKPAAAPRQRAPRAASKRRRTTARRKTRGRARRR